MPLKAINNWWNNEKPLWKPLGITERIKGFWVNLDSAPDSSKENIVVSLEEMSQIWLKCNRSYQKCQTPSIPMEAGGHMDVSPGASPSESLSLPDVLTGWSDNPELLESGTSGSPPPPPVDRTSGWSNEASEFIRIVVKPYEKLCENTNALDGIYQIIKILDDQGGCASIVQMGRDNADNDMSTMADSLRQVTLRSHSFNVAILGIERIKREWMDPEALIPAMIVAALGHDLGKLASLRIGDTYSKYDHPIISVEKVSSIFGGRNLPWVDKVLKAIREHHIKYDEQGSQQDQFGAELRYADGKARVLEIAKVTGKQAKEWKEWFDPTEFLARLRPKINTAQVGKLLKAFSYGGIVYFDTTFLQETAKEYAESENVIDLTVIRNTDVLYAVKNIVKSLREIGAVSDELANQGHCFKSYRISTTQGVPKKHQLVPLKAEAFGMPGDLEKNKDGALFSIKSMKPAETEGKG